MEQKDIDRVKLKCKEFFTRDYVNQHAMLREKLSISVSRFIEKKWDMDDCKQMYNYLNSGCAYITDRTCKYVREFVERLTGIKGGLEPCEACPWNRDGCCSVASDKTDRSWGYMMHMMERRLSDIIFNDEITDKDRIYINRCGRKMTESPSHKELYLFSVEE